MLRPSPWNGAHKVSFDPRFRQIVWIMLGMLGVWNVLYGLFKIDGFWFFMSLVSGLAMVLAAGVIASDGGSNQNDSNEGQPRSLGENSIVFILGLSFLVYAVTLIQLNLGYAILR